MTKTELVKIIKKLRDAAQDAAALEAKMLYPDWRGDKEYKVGDRVLYGGTLYKCLQDHTAQDGWTPTDAPSLWAEVLIPDPEVIPDWVQPESTNPYMKGDKVRYKGEVYESLIDNNLWSPEAYPDGWRRLLQ